MQQNLKTIALFITDKLPILVVVAGIAGFVVSPLANALAPATSWLLAVMMLGSGLNLPLQQVVALRGTLRLTLVALALQLTLLPLLSFGFYHLLPDPILGIGLLAVGVAPSEITSALMTMMAGGDLALGMRLMTFSIFLSVFLTPLWLGLFLGQSVPIDAGSIAVELGLIIALPFLIASAIRTRFTTLAAYSDEFGSLSALAVIALIFVVGGSLASFALTLNLLWLALACLLFNLIGYLLGLAISKMFHQPISQATALIFSSGMREFGIASAVAINFLPTGAAIAPAIYGLLMMFSASLLANYLKRRKTSNAVLAESVLNEPISFDAR